MGRMRSKAELRRQGLDRHHHVDAFTPIDILEQAVMADAMEAARKYVHQEAPRRPQPFTKTP
jgi:hypothetical protein